MAAEVLTQLNATPGLAGLTSYWTAPSPLAASLRSTDGKHGLIGVQVLGSDSDAPTTTAAIAQRLSGERGNVTVRCGGYALIAHDIDKQSREDLVTAEAVSYTHLTLPTNREV